MAPPIIQAPILKEESCSPLTHSLGLPLGQTHMPHERFNLFHIDNQEQHLESLSVSAFIHNGSILAGESSQLLQNGILHICSRSILFDQDNSVGEEKFLPDLVKFRYNEKFDFEVVQGEQLEMVHQQVQSKSKLAQNLQILDEFYRYLLFQTFPEILSASNVDEYTQILDESSLA